MTRWRPITTTAVSLCGLGWALYLTWGHYFDQASINSCPLSAGGHGLVDCGAVTTSSWSMILGLPVALYGAVFFAFMAAISLPVAWRSPSAWVARLRLAASVAGIGMVLYLVGVELLALHHICLYCTIVHVLQFALFVLVATGWQDTGWAAGAAEFDDEAYFEEEPELEPVVVPAKGNRPPRGKARRQASTLRA